MIGTGEISNPNKLGDAYPERVATAQRGRSRERLVRMCRSSLDTDALQREAIEELKRTVGFDRWCWPACDPETLVPGMGIGDHDYGPVVPRALELEFGGHDFATKDGIARRAHPVGSLNVDTSGDLARSPRWDEVLRPVGIGDVAAVACRDAFGCWGWIEAYRDSSDRPFSEDALELLAEVGPTLGHALRRTTQRPRNPTPGAPSPTTGILILDAELLTVTQNAEVDTWISMLPAAALFAGWGILPPPIYPVATLAREGQARRAHTLLPTDHGVQVRIDAAALDHGLGQIAVTFRAASLGETFDLFCRARGLTPRERRLVMLLVAGLDTAALTRKMGISRHTVQDHLKSVFDKVDVHSRRELLALIHGDLASEYADDPRD
ncbi:MAG TPA: helix-turn-helix transcriptional regulator [Actinomycetota bacterium]|nr:helix-turn-helix transcriptional regulator [Actinomycetota bacterium]